MPEGKENPFTRKAAADKEVQKSSSKRGRPPNTPNLDAVIAAIERGDYDEDIGDLREAIKVRNESRKSDVLRLVTDVFGEDAVIEFTKSVGDNSEFTRTRMNLGGNETFAAAARDALDQAASTNVDEPSTDAEIAVDDDAPTPDPLAHLDQVEATMDAEVVADIEPAPSAPVQTVEAPIEKRGAMISGLHSSDIGE